MEKKTLNRRKFLKGGAVATAGAASALAAPAVVSAQSPIVLKMQSSWPSSDVFQEMAQQYADRVEAMSGGRLKIDLLPAGAVVGAFIMGFMRNGCDIAGIPNSVQRILIGAVIVLAVAIDEFRHRRSA